MWPAESLGIDVGKYDPLLPEAEAWSVCNAADLKGMANLFSYLPFDNLSLYFSCYLGQGILLLQSWIITHTHTLNGEKWGSGIESESSWGYCFADQR
jgi:hypothetical protein